MLRSLPALSKLSASQIIGASASSTAESYITSELSAFPLNLFLTNNNHPDSSYHVKLLVDDIDMLHDPTPRTTDPNSTPTLVDYKILSRSNPLFNTLTNQFNFNFNFNFLQTPVSTSTSTPTPTPTPTNLEYAHDLILILSFTKEMLNSNTHFIKSKLRDHPFDIHACLLNTQTYPYLRDVAKSKLESEENRTRENLHVIAKYGLINVSKQSNGSLLLTA